MKKFRNLCAMVFMLMMATAAVRADNPDCPPELMGSCPSCHTSTFFWPDYYYGGCSEDCSENEAICANWCLSWDCYGSSDDCEMSGSFSYGDCNCTACIWS
jgi:hypothetical protein